MCGKWWCKGKDIRYHERCIGGGYRKNIEFSSDCYLHKYFKLCTEICAMCEILYVTMYHFGDNYSG